MKFDKKFSQYKSKNMKIITKQDGDGFMVQVKGDDDIYAWGETEDQAIAELYEVADRIQDLRLEEAEKARAAKSLILNWRHQYAV